MDTESEAQEAIDALHRSDFYGRELRVQPANTGERSSDNSKRRRRNKKGNRNKSEKGFSIVTFFKNLFAR